MILNKNTFNELKELMGEDFPILVDTFINDAVVTLSELEQAFTEGNGEEIKRGVHTLSGSAGNFGLENIYTLCKDIERAILNNNLPTAQTLFAMLKEEFTQAEKLLHKKSRANYEI